MPEALFQLSAFGDEIADDFAEQLQVLNKLRIGHLDLRGAWRTNILKMSDDMLAEVRRLSAAANIEVACIASPLGKSPITEPIRKEEENLDRLCAAGEKLGVRRIRVFSFYPPPGTAQAAFDAYVPEAAQRLARLVDCASGRGFELLLENEKDIVGDTVGRCLALVQSVDRPALRLVWDPANFVQVGEAHPTTDGWSLLGHAVSYVHIKDARLADGAVVGPGEGDGEVRQLLTRLRESHYRGILSLEPHLVVAGQSGGFTGVSGMRHAVECLRTLMAETGCVETHEDL